MNAITDAIAISIGNHSRIIQWDGLFSINVQISLPLETMPAFSVVVSLNADMSDMACPWIIYRKKFIFDCVSKIWRAIANQSIWPSFLQFVLPL
jgi:hypothetical protein